MCASLESILLNFFHLLFAFPFLFFFCYFFLVHIHFVVNKYCTVFTCIHFPSPFFFPFSSTSALHSFSSFQAVDYLSILQCCFFSFYSPMSVQFKTWTRRTFKAQATPAIIADTAHLHFNIFHFLRQFIINTPLGFVDSWRWWRWLLLLILLFLLMQFIKICYSFHCHFFIFLAHNNEIRSLDVCCCLFVFFSFLFAFCFLFHLQWKCKQN